MAEIDSLVGGSFNFLPGLLSVSGNCLSSSLYPQGYWFVFSAEAFLLYLAFPGFSDAGLSHPWSSLVCTLLFASLRAPSHLALTTATSFHLLLLFASLTILLMQIGLMLGVPNCFLLHLEKNQIPYCDVCCASAQWSLLLFISPMQFLSTNLNRCSPSPKHILPTKGQWLLRPSFPSDCCYLWNGLA